jgi:DNA-binding response OmpR family regulator
VSAAVEVPDLREARVLVAEDDDDLRELLEVCLAHAGAAVTVTSSVDAALATLDDVNPHVILFNVALEDAGLALARAAQDRKIPALALTERLRGETPIAILLRGHGATLVPAFDHRVVVAAVESAVKSA